MNESKIKSLHSAVVSWVNAATCAEGAIPVIGSPHVGQMAMPLRPQLKMEGNTSQLANTATRLAKPGRLCSHSKTVVFGLGIFLLLSTRGSARPENSSL